MACVGRRCECVIKLDNTHNTPASACVSADAAGRSTCRFTLPSTLGTRRGLMPHNDEACRVHTHDVVQHTPATQRGPALPSRHPQIYRQTRTFLERTGSLGGGRFTIAFGVVGDQCFG